MGKEKKKKSDKKAVPSDSLMEELLGAWMRMAIGIKGNRILQTLSFNEMVTCRLLYRAMQENANTTATDICRETRLLKSQVNRLLSDMEKKGLIYRQRDLEDKRKVLVCMKREGTEIYLAEHARVMELVGQVCDRLSRKEVESLVSKMSKTVSIMDELSEL